MSLSAELAYYEEIASDYHGAVISPFGPGVVLPLGRDLKRIARGRSGARAVDRESLAVDFGCGIGESLPMLARAFRRVVGVDFSPAMLDRSEARLSRAGIACSRLPHRGGLAALTKRLSAERGRGGPSEVILARGELERLEALRGLVGLALAVHTVTSTSVSRTKRVFAQIADCLERRGTLVAVFPSSDTLSHLERLESRRPTAASLGRLDPRTGMHVDASGDRLKFFTSDEIADWCEAEGLDVERLEKLRYPWKTMRRHGWGYHPRAPRLWDWYLVARRR